VGLAGWGAHLDNDSQFRLSDLLILRKRGGRDDGLQCRLAIGVLRRVSRRFWALTASLAMHSGVLVAASMVSLGAPLMARDAPEPLFVILGPVGPGSGGGVLREPAAESTRGPKTESAAGAARKESAPRVTTVEVGQQPRRSIDNRAPKLAADADSAVRPERGTQASPEVRAASTTDAAGGSKSNSLASASVGDESGIGGVGVGGGGGGAGAGSLAATYEQTLAAWLSSHKYYPSSLRRRGIEGEGKLRIRIARSGHVLAVDVAAAFTHPSLEAISEDWVKRAQPFPPVPDTIPGDSYVFIVPVGFRLQ